MDDFEAHRGQLLAVAYRMLGSRSDADDAVQEAWMRVARADISGVQNIRAWLTTVVARVCLDMLRSRTARREVSLAAPLPLAGPDPEQEAVLADSVGLALLVVLDTLAPAERLAFVLHDMFAVPYREIAPIIGRSSDATKMLASRARRRVRAAQAPDLDPGRQQEVVDAFLAASRDGDFAALLKVLHPDVTVCADAVAAPSRGPVRLRGARAVAGQALLFSHRAEHARTGLVDGVPAILVRPHGRLVTVLAFTIFDDRITAIDVIADPQRLRRLTVGGLEPAGPISGVPGWDPTRDRDAGPMRDVADVPVVGGPADGRTATVELDDHGQPPAELHPGEIDVDGDGLYVREPVVGAGPPWTYHWQVATR